MNILSSPTLIHQTKIVSIGFPVSNYERNPCTPQIIQEASFSASQKPLSLHLFHGFTSRFGANHLNSSLLEPSYPQIDSFVFSTVEALTKSGFIERIFNISSETKNFERVVGLSPNPLVIERIHKDTGESVSGGEIQIEESLVVREESEAEKEAWRILEDAVVRYCGSPVGTVAANDPGDKFPLNYDQVFIRDFVPSALAFLLKGEGEIVRNFLLHTLQLQVSLQNLSFRLLT